MSTLTLGSLGDAADHAAVLDQVADPIYARLEPILDSSTVGAALRGEWLGHPVHPLLTDVPIGCWTTAWMLDVFGGSDQEGWAKALIALGVVAITVHSRRSRP